MVATLFALGPWGNFGAFGAMAAAGLIQLLACLFFLHRFWRQSARPERHALIESVSRG